MYQKGDLLWIPAGTLLHRPRIAEKDDLFSNWYQTTKPCIALFLEFEGHNKSRIMMDGNYWSVDTKKIRHNVEESVYVDQVG